MPCPKLACPCHGLACHVKIVRAVSERVMIDPCQCRSVSIRVHVDPCQSVSNPGVAIFAEKSACGKLDSSNRACQTLDGHFQRKKSACGKVLRTTGLVRHQPKFGPTQDRQTCHQMGPESSVWPETHQKMIAWPPWFVMSGDQAIRRAAPDRLDPCRGLGKQGR